MSSIVWKNESSASREFRPFTCYVTDGTLEASSDT